MSWYIDFAYRTVGIPQMNLNFCHTPMQTLSVMGKFWFKTATAQDTLAICLEVQQRFFYGALKDRFIEEWKNLKKNEKIVKDF